MEIMNDMMDNGKMIKELEMVSFTLNKIGKYYQGNNNRYDGDWKADKKTNKGKTSDYIY